jgi:hypothetical protein
MILIFTENASHSDEIKKELALAGRSRTVIIPVRAENLEPTGAFAYETVTRQWIDLFKDWDRSIDAICRSVERARLSAAAPPPRQASGRAASADPLRPSAPAASWMTGGAEASSGPERAAAQTAVSGQKPRAAIRDDGQGPGAAADNPRARGGTIADLHRHRSSNWKALLGLAALLLVPVLIWWPFRSIRTDQPSVVVANEKAPAPPQKTPDKPAPANQTAPLAPVAVLYDEDPADPKGKQYAGTVVWGTEQIKASGNSPASLAVRADLDIPERKLKMTLSFRRNSDASLPASHTVEMTFKLPKDFVGGSISNVPGILMKANEQSRGTPLAGLTVKVTDDFYLLGMSNVEADRTRNLQLLKERSVFDIPLVYNNQRRAMLSVGKGAAGERAFSDALAAWSK